MKLYLRKIKLLILMTKKSCRNVSEKRFEHFFKVKGKIMKLAICDDILPKFMRANSKCYVNSLFIKRVNLRSVILKSGMIFQR